MPRHADFQLDVRPDLGFADFDRLMQQLRAAVLDVEVFAEIVAALHLEGRQLDVDQLASELRLDVRVVEIIERLASWGDKGELIHEFASVQIATVASGSLLSYCDLSTAVFVQRNERGFALTFKDENGGHGDVGEFERPLSLLEMTMVVDGILFRQAPYDITDGDWCSGYFCDPSMTVRVSSPYYPQLSAWYEQAIAEWVAANSGE